jgi:hypothetical protein
MPLPTIAELEKPPPWVLVAYAARCARRVASLILDSDIERSRQELFMRAIQNAERAAESGKADFKAEVDCYAWCGRYSEAVAVTADGAALASAGFAHVTCLHREAKWAADAANAASTAITFAKWPNGREGGISRTESDAAIRRDFEILRDNFQITEHPEESTVSPLIFALHAGFNFDVGLGRDTLIQIVQRVDRRLIEHLRSFPEGLYGMDPHLFEELVAEVIHGFGFDVEFTRKTRDGGHDIIAIKGNPLWCKYLIECKRYSRERRIDVGMVRQLHGVVTSERATKGLLVTTASFTGPSQEYLAQNKWVLEGRDFDGLVEWLKAYDTGAIQRFLPLVR